MQVQSPSSTPLPDELQKAIENGQNLVTLLEADTQRLARLKNTLDSDIRKLNTEKQIATDSLASTQTALTQAQADLESVKTSLDSAKAERTAVQADVRQQQDTLDQRTAELNKRESDLNAREQVITARESAISDRESEHTGRVDSFNEKRSALKQAIAASEL